MSSASADLIEDADRILRIFGDWPSFHDAEVLRLTLDRAGPQGPSLDLVIHAFEMTPDVDPSGFYVLKNHTLVTLRFIGVALESLGGFNHQNVLSDLAITPLDPEEHDGRRVGVTMHSSYGLEGSFECSSCLVADVEPYDVSA